VPPVVPGPPGPTVGIRLEVEVTVQLMEIGVTT
jgi:hypothetical protein